MKGSAAGIPGAEEAPREIELKLAIHPDHVERLWRDALLRPMTHRRGRRQRLVSVYFDTPDRALQRRGLALRVRRIGARWVQTLKDTAAGGAVMHVRREFECEVAGERPDLSRVADADLQAYFLADRVAEALAPVFTVEVERRSRLLRVADAEIELTIDVGEVRSDDRRMTICEVELERRSGELTRIFELALALQERVPFTIERRTKSERGYSLDAPVEPTPVRAEPVLLDAASDVQRAFTAIAANCLQQLLGNEASVRHGADPEGIHQMRVAVRRMRASIGLFRDHLPVEVHGRLSKELRWLQQQLGPAREWDVFIDETLVPLRRRQRNEQALEPMIRAAELRRAEGYATACEALIAPRYTTLLLRIGQWVETAPRSAPWEKADERPAEPSAIELARAVLQRNHKRMRKLGARHRKLSEADLHKLRLLGKRMRYSAEFFRSMFDRNPARRYLRALVAIQETLGPLNDAAVGRGLLLALEQRMTQEDPDRASRAIGIVQGWQAARIDRELSRFRKVWEAFAACKPFWRK